jgi:hypothetical protein
MAGVGDIVKRLFGPNSVTRQFFVWGVAQQLVQNALAPMYQAILNRANSSNPNVPASPAELADMAHKGIVGLDWAISEAHKSGIGTEIFKLMVQNVGQPPSLFDMLSLMRRGKISRDAVIRAIKQSHIKDEWIDTILLLGIQPPTPEAILHAYLQGQVDGDQARQYYLQLGGDPEFFDLLYNAQGAAPTPNEAAEMARKGIIPWEGTGPGVVSFQQAFLEGPWRNKWLDAWRKSSEYLPPPRTITAILREGSITVDEAKELLARQGVPKELIGAYITEASTGKTLKAKELTESTIRALYEESALDEKTTKEYLGKLRYTPAEADFVLMSWRLNRELKYRNSAITTVHTQFINHRVGNREASTALDKLGVPSAQRTTLLALWTEEAKLKVQVLTAAQVKRAAILGFLTYGEAIERLMQQGYNEKDAEIFMLI